MSEHHALRVPSAPPAPPARARVERAPARAATRHFVPAVRPEGSPRDQLARRRSKASLRWRGAYRRWSLRWRGAYRRCSLSRRRARSGGVQHELVAVGVLEERHVADAGVVRRTEERHALASSSARIARRHQRGAGSGCPSAGRTACRGARAPRSQSTCRRPTAPTGRAHRAHPEHVAVERSRALGVLRRDAEEVQILNGGHARSLPPLAARS